MLHHVLNVPNALPKYKGFVPPAYHQWKLNLYNSLKEILGSRKRATNDNAIIVSNLQSNTMFSLQSSKKSSCQMTIHTGMERTLQSDIHHTNNAILEMAIADFFIAKISQIGLRSPLGLSNYWRRPNIWGVFLKFHPGKIGGKTNQIKIILSFDYIFNLTGL